MYAAFYGTEQMVEILLPKSDVKASNNYDGRIALMYAARRIGANKMADWATQSLATPLINAVFNNDKNLVKRLLADGADAKATIGSGYTALMYAAVYGTEKMVELLLPKSDVKAVCCQTANNNGYTALDFAKSFGNSQIVSLLQQYN